MQVKWSVLNKSSLICQQFIPHLYFHWFHHHAQMIVIIWWYMQMIFMFIRSLCVLVPFTSPVLPLPLVLSHLLLLLPDSVYHSGTCSYRRPSAYTVTVHTLILLFLQGLQILFTLTQHGDIENISKWIWICKKYNKC